MSLNKVMLIGNVGKEPETRQVGDSNVIKFTLATTEKFMDRNGQQVENTEWHNIEYWVKSTAILQYLHKGTQVYVEGKLKTDSWDGQDGQKHYQTGIRANSVQLLGSKPQTAQTQHVQPQYVPQQPALQPQYRPQPQYAPQGFQQTGQFPQHPVNQPFPPQCQGGYQQPVEDLPLP